MKTGSSGTFVIPWSQTETDGVRGAPLDLLGVGTSWGWSGVAVRLDGPQDIFLLEGAEGVADLRRRAARMVRRLIGPAARPMVDAPEDSEALAGQSFVVTDGYRTYPVGLVTAESGGLLAVVSDLPPEGRELWVVRCSVAMAAERRAGGVICFTPGTRIATPYGARQIEHLRPGDRVLTRDNGAQPVLWLGQRRISGARLHLMPHLRPIRFRRGALGPDRPEPDLLVSPQHRMLVRGRAAQALFNCDEVLVAAEDMVNDATITVDRSAREVTYIHLLLGAHNILWANGLETESFHPTHAALETIDPVQRDGLIRLFPHLMQNPQGYGDSARRNLSASEAAILCHDKNP